MVVVIIALILDAINIIVIRHFLARGLHTSKDLIFC